MVKPIVVNIESCEVRSYLLATKLSKIQKLLCKWFKIVPVKKYYFTASIKTDIQDYLMRGDIVLVNNLEKWMVVNIDRNKNVYLRSLYPIMYCNLSGQLIVIGRTFSES